VHHDAPEEACAYYKRCMASSFAKKRSGRTYEKLWKAYTGRDLEPPNGDLADYNLEAQTDLNDASESPKDWVGGSLDVWTKPYESSDLLEVGRSLLFSIELI
jgi:hypothetical protein